MAGRLDALLADAPGLGGLTALFILLAPYVLRLFGSPGGDVDLAVGLSRVLFPIVVLLGLSGIVVGILNTHDHFTVPALTPVFWNLAIIVGLVIGVPTQDGESGKLYVYAGVDRRRHADPVPAADALAARSRRPATRRRRLARSCRPPFLPLLLPVTVGLGLININAVIDTVFASRLIDASLAPTAIDKAFRLYMLPQGMFSVAVATVLFPALSRLAARADHDTFRETVALGIRQIGFLLVPAARRVRRSRPADRSDRLPARRVHARPDDHRRRRARSLLARARLQRLDADAQPRVLLLAVELAADASRSRTWR